MPESVTCKPQKGKTRCTVDEGITRNPEKGRTRRTVDERGIVVDRDLVAHKVDVRVLPLVVQARPTDERAGELVRDAAGGRRPLGVVAELALEHVRAERVAVVRLRGGVLAPADDVRAAGAAHDVVHGLLAEAARVVRPHNLQPWLGAMRHQAAAIVCATQQNIPTDTTARVMRPHNLQPRAVGQSARQLDAKQAWHSGASKAARVVRPHNLHHRFSVAVILKL